MYSLDDRNQQKEWYLHTLNLLLRGNCQLFPVYGNFHGTVLIRAAPESYLFGCKKTTTLEEIRHRRTNATVARTESLAVVILDSFADLFVERLVRQKNEKSTTNRPIIRLEQLGDLFFRHHGHHSV